MYCITFLHGTDVHVAPRLLCMPLPPHFLRSLPSPLSLYLQVSIIFDTGLPGFSLTSRDCGDGSSCFSCRDSESSPLLRQLPNCLFKLCISQICQKLKILLLLYNKKISLQSELKRTHFMPRNIYFFLTLQMMMMINRISVSWKTLAGEPNDDLLRLFFWRCTVRTPVGKQAILNEVFGGFSSVLPGKYRDNISIRPLPLHPTSFPISHCSVILPFDAVC